MKPARPSSPGGGSAGDPSRLTASLRAAHRCVSVEIHPGQFSRWGRLPQRLVSRAPRRPRRSRGFHHRLFTASLRAAHRCVSVEIHPGQFSRWGLLPHAPCQPDPHRENWASPASALTRVPPPAVHRAASRRSSLRFSRNTSGIPPSRALSAGPPPGGLAGPRRSRRSRHFAHRLPGPAGEGRPRGAPSLVPRPRDGRRNPRERGGVSSRPCGPPCRSEDRRSCA